MQIRCSSCTKTIRIAPDSGALPAACPHCGGATAPPHLGAYAVDRLIATGGMGEVYAAHHRELGTPVAIKLLPAMPLAAIDGMRERFAREARLTARAAHPGVVRVLDSDVDGDRPFLVLEFVRGKTLRAHADGKPLPHVEAARLCLGAADVVAAVHQQGVLHRDLKPDNVMLQDDGQVRVLDFGLARAFHDDAALTQTGELVGTPEYMAPEQLLDGPEATDVRTDVHALGVMLFELLSGRSPHRGANVFQTLKLVESLEATLPDELDVPDAVRQLVQQAMRKQPDERPQSAAAFADALRQAVPRAASEPAAADAAAPPAGATAATSVLVMLVALWLLGVFDDSPDDRRQAGPELAQPMLDAVQSALADLAACEARLLRGEWSGALADAERLLRDDLPGSRKLARRAFVLSHAVWLQAAGLPVWLAASDLGQRQRLFGDLLEPGDAATREQRALLLGDADAWQQLDDPVAKALIAIRERPAPERAAAYADHARRFALDQPEHWLARLLEHHQRNDAAERQRAAEMAWLSGAGELAVLLEAALALPTAEPHVRTQLWQRVGAADRGDCPASTLLLLAIETRGMRQIDFEPDQAHGFPLPHRDAAAAWFVAQAATEPARAFSRLRVAVALDAIPDFEQPPWSRCSEAQREVLRQEQQRER